MLISKWTYVKQENDIGVTSDAVVRRCSVKNVFLKISQNPQESTCPTVPFSGFRPQASNFIKKRLSHRCFPKNFANFLRTSIFIECLPWLLFTYTGRIFISRYYYRTWMLKNESLYNKINIESRWMNQRNHGGNWSIIENV